MKKLFKVVLDIPKYVVLLIIMIYKFCISPFIPHVCKYTPTCSSYAVECFVEWGFFIGSILVIKRLLKCNCWSKGGLDTMPINIKKKYKNYM